MVGLFEETQITKYLDVVETGLGSYGRLKIDTEQKHEVFYFLSSLAFFLLIGKELENIHYIWMLLSFSVDKAFLISDLSKTKKKYDKIAYALDEVDRKGYGIVTPSIDEHILDEPEMVKQGSRFGVKLKAKAPSIHMIRADIETEVSPIVGSEKQSEELVNYLLSEFESDPQKIWESNIFGKSLHELVNEGLQNKLCRMPEDAQEKLQETLERIVNEGSGGLICIIL